MFENKIDAKVVDKVRKLLALARDGAASENEAAVAMERAQSIMAEHGITSAMAEMSGGEGERRVGERTDKAAAEWWMPELMKTICETCFVHVRMVGSSTGRTAKGYELIGRESARLPQPG